MIALTLSRRRKPASRRARAGRARFFVVRQQSWVWRRAGPRQPQAVPRDGRNPSCRNAGAQRSVGDDLDRNFARLTFEQISDRALNRAAEGLECVAFDPQAFNVRRLDVPSACGAPPLTLRSLRDDRADARGRFVSKASTPKSRRVAPVFGVEALVAHSLSRAQWSSLAEGDARQRAWA